MSYQYEISQAEAECELNLLLPLLIPCPVCWNMIFEFNIAHLPRQSMRPARWNSSSNTWNIFYSPPMTGRCRSFVPFPAWEYKFLFALWHTGEESSSLCLVNNDTNLRNSCVAMRRLMEDPQATEVLGEFTYLERMVYLIFVPFLWMFNSIFIAVTFGNTGSDINRWHAKGTQWLAIILARTNAQPSRSEVDSPTQLFSLHNHGVVHRIILCIFIL